MMKKAIITFIFFLFIFQNVYCSENNLNIYGIGNSVPYEKDNAQFEDIATFIRLASLGLGEFIDLIIFIRENLPTEQARDLVRLLLNIIDDVSINEGNICMPVDVIGETFRELTRIMLTTINTTETN
jgi:hypothetical protein